MLASVELKKRENRDDLGILQNFNNTTDLFPRVSYQLSSFRRETGMLRSAVKEKIRKVVIKML
jgi:hypothetical protein